MKKIDLIAIKDALECAEAEFEQLMIDKEWYVTEVNDRIADAKERVMEALYPRPLEEE